MAYATGVFWMLIIVAALYMATGRCEQSAGLLNGSACTWTHCMMVPAKVLHAILLPEKTFVDGHISAGRQAGL